MGSHHHHKIIHKSIIFVVFSKNYYFENLKYVLGIMRYKKLTHFFFIIIVVILLQLHWLLCIIYMFRVPLY